MDTLSKTQIDKLGKRLKLGDVSEADLKILNDYRESFNSAYEEVIQIIRDKC